MNVKNFEALSNKFAGVDMSATIDIDPNWFNGSCIKTKDNDAVYLVMDGKKKHVPNPDTYNNLFKNWNQINDGGKLEKIWNKIVDSIPTGEAITDGAILIKDESDPVYLLTNKKKYWITDPDQFNNCNFDWNKIKKYPTIVIDAIERGENDVFKPTEIQ